MASMIGNLRHGLQSNYAFDGEIGLVPIISYLVLVYVWLAGHSSDSQLTQDDLRNHP